MASEEKYNPALEAAKEIEKYFCIEANKNNTWLDMDTPNIENIILKHFTPRPELAGIDAAVEEILCHAWPLSGSVDITKPKLKSIILAHLPVLDGGEMRVPIKSIKAIISFHEGTATQEEKIECAAALDILDSIIKGDEANDALGEKEGGS